MAANSTPRLLRKRLREQQDKTGQPWIEREPATLGDNSGTVIVPGTTNLAYARLENGRVVKVWNSVAPFINDWKVYVGKDKAQPSLYRVLEVRWIYNLANTFAYILFHHLQHEYPGPDTVWIRRDQFMPLLVLPNSGLHIKFYGDVIYDSSMSNPIRVLDQADIDMSSYVPVSGAVYVMLEITPTGSLNYVTGDNYASLALLRDNAPLPTPTVGSFPVCAIEMYYGQTEIRRDSTERNIIDLRLFASATSVGMGEQINDAPAGTLADAYKFGFWNTVTSRLENITAANLKVFIGAPYDAPTATNDFLIGASVAGVWTWAKNTLAQTITVLRTSLDSIYAPIAKGVTNGDSHDHAGGDGAQIDHVNLANIGTNTHATIDTHLASTSNPHSTTAAQVVAAPTTYTPVFTSSGGTPTTVTVNSAKYTNLNKIVVANVDYTITDKGTATGDLIMTLPVASNVRSSGNAIENGATGKVVSAVSEANSYCVQHLYDGNTLWVNGYRVYLTIVYFTA